MNECEFTAWNVNISLSKTNLIWNFPGNLRYSAVTLQIFAMKKKHLKKVLLNCFFIGWLISIELICTEAWFKIVSANNQNCLPVDL